ncbi:MAG TPA: NAD(P)/FAD-dependent oxidoreductase [Acidimicrobiia bacterium]|nr:NAD(P)/FAD-dependent oxidoreductase [Acidimicrobiia bacterium]
MERFDAVVVGSGPNGLAAATTLADAGRSVLVLERSDDLGGGTRSYELTEPGVRHDLCATAHPTAVLSPYYRTLPLADHGLEWVHAEFPAAHAVRPGVAVPLPRDLDEAVDSLGEDGDTYRGVMGPIVRDWAKLEDAVLGPIPRIPAHPVSLVRFGINALAPATLTARRFRTERAKALFAGCAAHSFLPLTRPLTASFGWFLMATAHLAGWPVARGGSSTLRDALVSYARSRGVEFRTGVEVKSLRELPPRSLTLLDVTPNQFATMAADDLPPGYLRRATRFVRGPGVFKLDAVTDRPIPWANPTLARAGTVHLDGTVDDIVEAEAGTFAGHHVARPFILVVQATGFDPTRAPEGTHTVWAYAHVPNGSPRDHTQHIIDRIEEHAPGFRSTVRAVHSTSPAGLEDHNPNYQGGDISGGAHTIRQLVFRPFPQRDPYATPLPGVFLCSSSTPPGAGTHGMCGHRAARSALAWTGS